MIGLGVAVLVVLAIVVFALLNSTDKLDQNAAQQGVQKVLEDAYAIQNVSDVSCPADQKVQEGAKFTCSVTIDGAQKAVTSTFTDDSGTYEVGRPN